MGCLSNSNYQEGKTCNKQNHLLGSLFIRFDCHKKGTIMDEI